MQNFEEKPNTKAKSRADRLPNVAIDNVPPGTASALMNTLSIIAPSDDKKRIQDMTNQELRAEIDSIVNKCIQNDVRIGIEVLCMGLRTTKQTLWNYEHGIGCDEERKNIICDVKQFLRAYIEQLTLTNKVNAPVGIFWSKNYLGMRDVVEVEKAEPQRRALTIAELPKLEELDKPSTSSNDWGALGDLTSPLKSDWKPGDDDELLFM